MKGTNGTGGWMDAVTYMAGLSGGSWAAGSFVANGGAMPTDLNANVWDMDFGLLGPSGNNSEFLSNIAALVSPKHELGFPVQVSDIWGISIAQHVLPREHRMDTNPNMTISGLPSTVPAYGNGSLPMPIIIAAS
jgi:lysophospholipase